jgi:hypothetical protein
VTLTHAPEFDAILARASVDAARTSARGRYVTFRVGERARCANDATRGGGDALVSSIVRYS